MCLGIVVCTCHDVRVPPGSLMVVDCEGVVTEILVVLMIAGEDRKLVYVDVLTGKVHIARVLPWETVSIVWEGVSKTLLVALKGLEGLTVGTKVEIETVHALVIVLWEMGVWA